MKLSLSPPPYADAPVVVLISGLGGSGSYWLPQLAVLECTKTASQLAARLDNESA